MLLIINKLVSENRFILFKSCVTPYAMPEINWPTPSMRHRRQRDRLRAHEAAREAAAEIKRRAHELRVIAYSLIQEAEALDPTPDYVPLASA